MTRDDVRAFVTRHFVPANMVLGIAGGVSPRRLRQALRAAFPTGDRRPHVRLPRLGRPATGTVRFRRRDFPQTYLVRLIAAPPTPRALLALSVAIEIVGADPDARLFQEVRERLGLGYDLGASVEQGTDWAVATFSASASRGDERRLRETIDRTCREAEAGFSTEEFRRARRKIAYRFARLADSRLDRALAHASRAASGHQSLAWTERMIAALRPAEIEDAWRRTLAAPTLTAVLRQ
jgi:predicted Zn-dependent peptidase